MKTSMMVWSILCLFQGVLYAQTETEVDMSDLEKDWRP